VMVQRYAERDEAVAGDPAVYEPERALDIADQAQTGLYCVVKRALDIVGAVALLLLFGPVLLVAAIGTRLGDGGSVIFWQERIGRGVKPFRVAKFRTMVIDAEQRWEDIPAEQKRSDGATKVHDDPRVTGFGRFLRRFSIDELPQLWNVLKGEMSLIGPRPFVPGETDAYPEAKRIRHSVPPGLTGWAQVHGRSEIELPEILEYDIEYVRSRSLWLDLVIACKTPVIVLRGIGAK
jgi:lipopolysaccharide/colanic/teichoic acid biosynthesis glycosyltransferase